ncbi:ABC transporter substrate-binding protein [Microbacterium sp. ASV49]|uniref:ABC transporter substrate-binding protein n=1 Tax=Microbacterium candidum TaxID=3041922 RepID=A0ABT7MY13_9MICO|nr:ABC transporter substrate-binding protein [Microbacterium sp. ASV49]MDL9979334.1 ABC transporter substrate-binding protein [Microbacterium sp. ASV49]
MRGTKITATVAGFVLAAVALAGCSGSGSADPSTSAGGDPIKVVVLGGIGGKGILADNATTSVTAAKASVNAINEKGGILGRKVEIQVIDDTGDPTVAVTKLREAVSGSSKPDIVLNSGPSTITEAMLPIVTQNKILSFDIGPTATSGDPKKSPYNFDLSASVPDYLGSFVDELKNRSVKKVAILHGSSAYGELFGQMSSAAFTKAGMTVTGDEGYDVAALDMTPQLAALQQGNPDVLVLDAYGAPLGYVLQGIQKLGWNVPIMGNTSVAATGLISTPPPTGVLGTDAVKNLTMQVYTSTKYDANATAVNDAVQQMLKAGDIKSSLILAYNYDSMFLVKAAAEKAGKFDTAAIAQALIDPAVQKSAGTAILSLYGFTAAAHSPHVQPSDFLFISPGPLVDGQFH